MAKIDLVIVGGGSLGRLLFPAFAVAATILAVKGGTLNWLVQPFNTENRPPTYGPDHATLLSLRPGSRSPGIRLLRRSTSVLSSADIRVASRPVTYRSR